jgi:hypothetical protein
MKTYIVMAFTDDMGDGAVESHHINQAIACVTSDEKKAKSVLEMLRQDHAILCRVSDRYRQAVEEHATINGKMPLNLRTNAWQNFYEEEKANLSQYSAVFGDGFWKLNGLDDKYVEFDIFEREME